MKKRLIKVGGLAAVFIAALVISSMVITVEQMTRL